MAELVLLIMLGPRNRINAIDQTQRSVYTLPKEFLQAWNTFTTEHPEIWTHLPNRESLVIYVFSRLKTTTQYTLTTTRLRYV